MNRKQESQTEFQRVVVERPTGVRKVIDSAPVGRTRNSFFEAACVTD